MKRVKIMLMGICLIALASGVLAFKAKTPGLYCTTLAVTTQVGGNFVCPTGRLCANLIATIVSTTETTAAGVRCYTEATIFRTQITCTVTTQQGGPGVTLTCDEQPVTLDEES